MSKMSHAAAQSRSTRTRTIMMAENNNNQKVKSEDRFGPFMALEILTGENPVENLARAIG